MILQDSKVVLDNSEVSKYKDELINRCFAILGIYEDCESTKEFSSYIKYTDRIKYEFIGFYNNTKNVRLISIINIVTGLQNYSDITHKQVKSLVFHIISTIQKMEV